MSKKGQQLSKLPVNQNEYWYPVKQSFHIEEKISSIYIVFEGTGFVDLKSIELV